MPNVIGIDPGSTGAATVRAAGFIEVFRFEKHSRYQWLRWIEDQFLLVDPAVFVENVHALPDDDPVSAWAFGRNVEKVHFVLDVCNITPEMVDAGTWQREFGLGGNLTGNPNATRDERYEAKKKACWHYAEAYFAQEHPEIKVLKTIADSMLIAEYGWRKLHGVLTNGKDGKGTDRVGRGVVRTSTWVER